MDAVANAADESAPKETCLTARQMDQQKGIASIGLKRSIRGRNEAKESAAMQTRLMSQHHGSKRIYRVTAESWGLRMI